MIARLLRLALLLAALPILAAGNVAAATQEPYIGSWPTYSTYDIRAYGAVGDGTTDDTQAIQAAQLAAENTVSNCGGGSSKCGATILVPCGNYYIKTGPVTISSNGSGGGITWRAMCGPLTFNESATYSGTVFVNKGDTIVSATVTATIASPSVFTGLTVPNGTKCWLKTTVNLPGNFSPYIKYFVVGTSGNTFQLALTSGGTAINGTGSQAGTHTVYCGKNSSVTVTSASPGVVSWTSHGLVAGQSFFFGGTTAPTGTTLGTQYFVSPTGLTANTFQFCTTSPALSGTCTLVNTSSTGTAVVAQLLPDTVYANAESAGGVDFLGPSIFDIGFVGVAGTAGLHANNFMHGLVSHSSFRDHGWGIYMEGANDDSDWVIGDKTMFRNNGVSFDCQISTNGGCNNGIIGNYFVTNAQTQMSIRVQSGNAQIRIIGNKFDANTAEWAPAITTQANQTLVMGNDFENPSPAVIIPPSPIPASLNGRGLRIIGNQFNMGGGTITVGTLSCTTTNSSTSVTTCSGGTLGTTASLLVGMNVSGTCVNGLTGGAGVGPFVYGTGGAGTATNPNTMTGINSIAAITSSSAITLSQNTGSASCGAGTVLTFAYPPYQWPSGSNMPYAVTVTGNSYIGFGSVPDSNHGNDGG